MESPPGIEHEILQVKRGSTLDEKEGEDIATLEFQGGVYDDLREIDLGEDGKERPIGKHDSGCSVSFLLSVVFRNRHGCGYEAHLFR